MLANSQFLAVDQRPKKATVSTILLMHAVGVSVDQRHLFEARNISFCIVLLFVLPKYYIFNYTKEMTSATVKLMSIRIALYYLINI